MSKFLEGIIEFRSISEVEAYDRVVSKWLQEALDGGFEKQLLEEMIFYAKKVEDKRNIEIKKLNEDRMKENPDGSRNINLR